MISFKLPEGYNAVIAFADTVRNSFEAIRNARPKDLDAVKKSLEQFLINCRFENCYGNKDYINALGFKSQ